MATRGPLKVATMLAFSSSHMIEADSNELMWLIGRRRRRGKIGGVGRMRMIIAARSAGQPFILFNEWQCIASILGSLTGIMFQSPTTCRLYPIR